jgi:hypothetical protein
MALSLQTIEDEVMMTECDTSTKDLCGKLANIPQTTEIFVEGLFFSLSHMSLGIQLVDMIAGAIWRAQSHNDRTWYDKLRPSFRSSPTGKIDGFGLARFPKAGWIGNILD